MGVCTGIGDTFLRHDQTIQYKKQYTYRDYLKHCRPKDAIKSIHIKILMLPCICRHYGNVDSRNDPLNYNGQDENGLPVGLSTTWTSGGHTDTPGEFNVVLKHQPDIKTATSDATIGGTNIDITFPLVIEEEGEEEEVINQIVLTFTPGEGGDAETATWFDEDGEGLGAPSIDDIELAEGITYDMTIALTITLGMEVEDVTAEIQEEDDEHMFFFSFTDGIFSNPMGDGKVDNRNDPLNYNDQSH